MKRTSARTIVWAGAAAACILLGAALAPAQPTTIDRQYEIKAKFLYFLAENLQRNPSPAGKPIIAAVGKQQAGIQQFEDTTRPLKSVDWAFYPDVAKFINAVKEKPSVQPHILFFFRDEPNKIDEALEELDRNELKTMVLVTEQPDRFRKVAANFYEDRAANRVRVQLRKSSLPQGVTPTQKLLTLSGVTVYD